MTASAKGRLYGVVIVAVLVLCAVGVFLKVDLSGRAEYARASKLFEEGKLWEAVGRYDRAMHWYSPLSGHVEDSARDLWRLGERAEAEGDAKLALLAYRTIRSAFYAARSYRTPGKDWIARCDEKIVELASEQPEMVDRVPDEEARREEVRRSLGKYPAPDAAWSLAAVIGFLGWIGAALGFIFLGFGRDGRWIRRRAALWGLLVVLFYTLWIAGLYYA